ncbi:MAG: hypothetical protein ACRD0P_11450 [Stackebrandtia sp.]
MTTTQLSQDPSPATTGIAAGWAATAPLVVAPALLAIGTVLMITPNEWTVAHLTFLGGAVAMLAVGGMLFRLFTQAGAAYWLGRIGGALTIAGALTLSGQFVIDIAVMRLAEGESEAMSTMFNQLQESWVLSATFYSVGPALLYLGLAAAGIALLRSSLVAPGWILTAGALLMASARIVDIRAIEVVALVLVLGALTWTAQAIRTGRLA